MEQLLSVKNTQDTKGAWAEWGTELGKVACFWRKATSHDTRAKTEQGVFKAAGKGEAGLPGQAKKVWSDNMQDTDARRTIQEEADKITTVPKECESRGIMHDALEKAEMR